MRSTPILAEYLHWLVVNIPGNQVGLGQELQSYAGPTPPPDTGIHRYIFLVYCQPTAIDSARIRKLRRPNFSHATFAAEYKLGEPIASFLFGVETP